MWNLIRNIPMLFFLVPHKILLQVLLALKMTLKQLILMQ